MVFEGDSKASMDGLINPSLHGRGSIQLRRLEGWEKIRVVRFNFQMGLQGKAYSLALELGMWALHMGFEGFLSSIAQPFVTVDAFRQDCLYHSFAIILVLCSVDFFSVLRKKQRKKEQDIVDQNGEKAQVLGCSKPFETRIVPPIMM